MLLPMPRELVVVLLETISFPPETVTAPVKVLDPASVSAPLPDTISPPDPAITDEIKPETPAPNVMVGDDPARVSVPPAIK